MVQWPDGVLYAMLVIHIIHLHSYSAYETGILLWLFYQIGEGMCREFLLFFFVVLKGGCMVDLGIILH